MHRSFDSLQAPVTECRHYHVVSTTNSTCRINRISRHSVDALLGAINIDCANRAIFKFNNNTITGLEIYLTNRSVHKVRLTIDFCRYLLECTLLVIVRVFSRGNSGWAVGG